MAADTQQVYRGNLRAAVGVGGTVAFVTVHPEGQPTAVYRLNADKLTVEAAALPCGGTCVAAAGETLYVGGTDHRLYVLAGKKPPKPLGDPRPHPVAAVLPVANQRIAVLNGKQIDLVSEDDGSVQQTLELPDDGTCLAADRTGQWLAAGTARGTVAVFDGQDRAEFEPAESDRLHDGAVTALLFEPEELRFFSAGADGKLLTTHARGRLEPEDKGRGNNHEDTLTAMLLVSGDRFVTGGRDAALKSWPRAGAVKPATLKDGVGKVLALAAVTVYNQTHLAALCDDNTIRLFKLEDDGRFAEGPPRKVVGALDWADNELSQAHDPKRRERALKSLADWKDAASIDRIGVQLAKDGDHQLRLLAAKLLVESDSPRVVKLLEGAVSHADERVRVEAFHGLYKRLKPDFGPIDLALKGGHANVGVLAVKELEPLAAKDDQALARLTAALNHAAWDVRRAALAGLEAVFEKESPQASLTALTSKHGDVRAAALARAFERGLLADPRVQSAVRRRLEDDDTAVRQVAFLLSVQSRAGLAAVLRTADPELNRQCNELEKADKPDRPPPKPPKGKLDPADYDVLLQATASRALDTCLRGARGLAVLGDPRAFGLLLQLSREDDTTARVEVCRALAALKDGRAVNRLRSLLYDPQASVRDAAYTALARIFEATPLAAAEAGLTAAEEDVRRRGLQTLITTIRQSPPKSATDSGWELLVRALNDGVAGVRGEAFKAALNLKIAGGGPDTLRFTLQSIHADVRREALTEVTAQEKEPWATPLLYEFFNDPDPGLRAEAFNFATRKNKEVPTFEAALGSRFADARRLAVEGLIKKHSKAAQAVLVRALADADKDVRWLAVVALVEDDAKGPLTQALESDRADVRVRAAVALAKHGEPASLAPLLYLATAPEPPQRERVADWLEAAELALAGLGELGDPATLPAVVPHLNSPHAALRKAAAAALVWAARPATAGELRSALSHADPQVKFRAALGLAFQGDASIAPLVMSDAAGAVVGPGDQFTAAVALGDAAADQLAVFLDHADEPLRNRALLVMLLLELKDTDGVPDKILACLSAKHPRFRLTAARGLEAYHDPAAFAAFVLGVVNDRGDDQAWKLTAGTVDTLATLLAFAPPQLKARTARLLAHFADKEPAAWNQAWAAHAARFAPDIAGISASAPRPVASKLSKEQLRELAFGAYVGLVREQGSAAAGPVVVKVREAALNRVFAIAQNDPGYARAARPVLVQALGDPNQPVRTRAFEHLLALGLEPAALGAEALEAGHTDLGVKGLELLAGGGSSAGGDAVLERVMLARTDDLATEAAKLLLDRQGKVPTAGLALDAVHEPLRTQAVQWLAAEYDASPDAQSRLRAALESRYRKVREAAAFELATKKDAAAFGALVTLLREAAEGLRQKKVIAALTRLGDPRAADAFLDRLENDPAGTALVEELFVSAAGFRVPATAGRVLALADRKKEWRGAAFAAAQKVAGYDQFIADAEDENPDRSWEKDQHPRHDDILARLLDKAFALGDTTTLENLIPEARWSRGPDADPVLALLASHPDEDVRHAAVEAVGWRLRKRNGPADPLLKSLRHKDPTTQFLAASGLARGRRPEGLSVLLSSIEFLDDVSMRQRAVLALGELGDPRAVDTLLRLAGEDGHALQDAAAEAVGHLSRSPQADAVFRLLERLAKGTGSAAQRALTGLRWFNTPLAWNIVRAKATAKGHQFGYHRRTAVCELGHNDDPATRDLLLRICREEPAYDLVEYAFASARRLFGPGSLEPHYALLQNPNAEFLAHNFDPPPLDAVAEKGDALRIMGIFPQCVPAVQQQLEAALLSRAGVSAKDAVAALAHADEGTVRLATRLIGRQPKADAAVKAAVADALSRWWATWWQDRRVKVDRDPDAEDSFDRATGCVESLLWAAGRAGVDAGLIADVAKARPDDPRAKPVRLAAVRALAAGAPSAATLGVLASLAAGPDADVRVLAAEVIARADAKRAAALIDGTLSDRPAFNRLAAAGAVPAAKVRSAAGQVHYQPVVLPLLVTAKDVPTLAAVAKDRKAPEAARLGAVEGLGVMAAADAEAVLVEVGTAKDDDKDVRKAAWRALRRSKRARKKSVSTG